MPIEIKELHIKTYVGEEEKPETNAGSEDTENIRDLKSKIVADCVEQVMQVLKEKKER
ncbi:MAG: DUF5908 family protein [Bacteroidales bacterium]|nr:hypothetical protein [Bacteroidales bacterium]MBS3776933.1 hypothetical protein [Bacteroidales bacterium]